MHDLSCDNSDGHLWDGAQALAPSVCDLQLSVKKRCVIFMSLLKIIYEMHLSVKKWSVIFMCLLKNKIWSGSFFSWPIYTPITVCCVVFLDDASNGAGNRPAHLLFSAGLQGCFDNSMWYIKVLLSWVCNSRKWSPRLRTSPLPDS